jgi:hypothetical protein
MYALTFGQPVSQLAGSPVANVALLIGRAVSGVYAKVMNFRSIDPRVPGEGMSGAGETDRLVWTEFYDPASANLRTEPLSFEFARLWPEAGGDVEEGAEASAAAATLANEAKRLEQQSLEQLVAKFRAQMRQRSSRPRKRILATYEYDRDPLVVAIAQKRAGHRCEIHACVHPTFQTTDGLPYTEVHHIIPLSEDGPDTIENVACLCAAHHREIHVGVGGLDLIQQLMERRRTDSGTALPPAARLISA